MRNIEDHGIEGVKVILVGNKVDLEAERQVSTRRGQKLASQHGIKLYETSAWKDVNVTDAFTSLTELVLNEVEPPIRRNSKSRTRKETNSDVNEKIVLEDTPTKSKSKEGSGGCCS